MGIVCLLLGALQLLVVAAIVVSWFPIQPGSGLEGIHRLLTGITDPVLGPIRQVLPPLRLGASTVDLSPLVVLLLLSVLQALIC